MWYWFGVVGLLGLLDVVDGCWYGFLLLGGWCVGMGWCVGDVGMVVGVRWWEWFVCYCWWFYVYSVGVVLFEEVFCC